MAKDKVDVYQIVTDRIIEALEQGTVPWRKPWKSPQHALQRNFNSKRAYRGLNQFLLSMSGYQYPFWATFKGWQKAGGQVRKGEKSTLVVFWKIMRFKDENGGTDKDGKPKVKTIPLLRYYRVFNIDQVDGVEIPMELLEPDESVPFEPIENCDQIWEGYKGKPVVLFGSSGASYAPVLDKINMPDREDFDSPEHYYATLFHEGVHSTGHKDRLNREEIAKATITFGDNDYSNEELCAEMGAAMLCAVAGIDPQTIENSASYIQNWLSKLRNDKKLLVSAAGRAQKAADYMLGVSYEEAENGESDDGTE